MHHLPSTWGLWQVALAAALALHCQLTFCFSSKRDGHTLQHGPALPWQAMTVSKLSRMPGNQRMHNILEAVQVRNTRTVLDSGVSIQPDRQALADGSGEWFEVTWSGIANPAYDDWIALVVPADANLTETAIAKWKFAAEAPTHITGGNGSLRFRLISYGHDMAFAVLRNGFSAPVEVARSQPIKVLNPDEPLQVHLALTGRPGEMLVQWVTAHRGVAPSVSWGRAPLLQQPYEGRARARSSTYTAMNVCGEPATTVGWVDPGYQHVAVMHGLMPSTRYYYTVGDSRGGGYSREFSFVSSPPVGPDQAIRLLAVADMGQGELDGSLEGSEMLASLTTTARMDAECPDCTLLMHYGDISYSRGFATQWVNFFAQLQPLASRMPYMVAAGNHERDWPNTGDMFGVQDSGGECGTHFERRIVMPYPGVDKEWYSFDYGPAHFLVYSTEVDFMPGSEQHAFVMSDLAAVDRSRTPWLLVGGHRPWYVSSTNTMWPDGDQPVGAMLREAFEEAFLRYKVDLTLHGHHHTYQRTCAMYQGKCVDPDSEGVAQAPTHLIIGNAGAGLSLNIANPDPEWLEAMALWWGYMRLEINGTTLQAEVVSDATGGLLDSLQLHKPADWGIKYMMSKAGKATTK